MNKIGKGFYSRIELRHQTNSFYLPHNTYHSQDPSMHVRCRMGALFYSGKLDLHGKIGAIKLPQTRKVIQSRPTVGLDYYPWFDSTGYFLFYNRLSLPFSESEFNAKNAIPQYQGTRTDSGMAVVYRPGLLVGSGRLGFNMGVDIWGNLFSRRQFLNNEYDWVVNDGEADLDGVRWEAEKSPVYSRWFTGVEVRPSFFPDLLMRADLFFNFDYLPKYTIRDGELSTEFGERQSSFYRIQLEKGLVERTALIVAFYHYFQGAFAEQAVGTEKRRYRGIARLTVDL